MAARSVCGVAHTVRLSGATAGPRVGHVTPEAYDGGPIAALEDWDEITTDVPNGAISVKLSPSETEARLARVQRKEKPALGFMARYRKLVSTAPRGAVLE